MMSRVVILSGALLPCPVVSVPLVALICLLLYCGDILSAQLSAPAPLGASSPQLLASRGKLLPEQILFKTWRLPMTTSRSET